MRYLTHKDNLEKYQYNDNEVITNNIEIYSETITIPLHKLTDTDKLLNEFIGFVTTKIENDGTSLSYLDIMRWFQQQNAISYFVQHYKALVDMSTQLFNSSSWNCTEALIECDINDLKEFIR